MEKQTQDCTCRQCGESFKTREELDMHNRALHYDKRDPMRNRTGTQDNPDTGFRQNDEISAEK